MSMNSVTLSLSPLQREAACRVTMRKATRTTLIEFTEYIFVRGKAGASMTTDPAKELRVRPESS